MLSRSAVATCWGALKRRTLRACQVGGLLVSFLGAPLTAAEQQFSREQLDQLTAQVALYPDALLSQVLMATYPSDVLFRVLAAQGPGAPGRAKSYIHGGRMSGGSALVAWPARYGDTGVMTFIVSRDAVVYEKDLGPQTASIARAMKAYEPDATWKKADIND